MALPRAFRWLIVALILLGLFLAWSDVIRPTADAWRASGDSIEADYATVRDSSAMVMQFKRISEPIVNIGPVKLPDREEDEGSKALIQAVNEVLARHSVYEDSFNVTAGQKLKTTDLPGLETNNQRVQRLIGTLRFEAAPADTTAIIAALESHPDVEAVRMARLSRASMGRLKVMLTLEAWVLSSDATRLGGRG